jgi:glutathione S-transferase
MLTVHHLNNSRSQRILWLLEELELSYEIKHYQRDPKTMLAPPELKAIHPLGKSPVVTDGDKVLAETGAIIDYILTHYAAGRLTPPDGTPDRLALDYWLHYAEGSAMPPLLLSLVFGVLPERAPFFVKPIVKGITATAMKSFIKPQLDLHIGYWEGVLDKTPWFAGQDMTAADIMMSFPVEAAASRGGLDKRYPRLQAFLKRIHGRAAYQRALEKGGPYAYA